MPRPPGKRNPEYETRRRELLESAIARLLDECHTRPSLRALADASGVSLPTIVHYFGNRESLLTSVFELIAEGGKPHLEHVAKPSGLFSSSIRELVETIAGGFRDGILVAIHSLGLLEGIRQDTIGPLYLQHLLEPSLNAIAMRLQVHIERGEMRRVNARYAANSLLSPILVAFLHQTELDGNEHFPLDLDDFLRTHATGFIRGYEKQT